MAIDKSKVRTYEMDLQKGVFKADGPEDHARLIEALKIVQSHPPAPQGVILKGSPAEPSGKPEQGLKPLELLEKFLNLKSHLKPATAIAYKNTVGEFQTFLKNPVITSVGVSDITRFQEHIAKTNAVRTVDNKIGTLSALFNFAIKQGYYFDKNPAEGRAILTKKQRLKQGWVMFEEQEVKQVFDCDFMRTAKIKDPDYYWVVVLGLVSGCRIGEITSLEVSQFQQTEKGNFFLKIRDSKTIAGIREVPLPETFFTDDFKKFIGDRKGLVFKYQTREGKGAGNAVGKKFKRHLEELKIKRPKLVFHSLRKFTNDFFMKNGIAFEPRCHVLGHEIENVNVATYSKQFNIDELSVMFNPIQNQLLIFAKVLKTEF
ncbi:phage integrase SAM-like domain-containing protein [Burkholderia multivorans]|uniref:phage integrase SAM-like domain-containing protein n=1 Tax=Burkholderia multivorans TaxID=87883 RepID=UPI000CFE8427|nr:phage integrase N-terminal SAM-like domain-containing protein [Burkholderia multivorans]PRG16968.1 hypothetical protein C6T62_29710 [Burkholderia multivorans]